MLKLMGKKVFTILRLICLFIWTYVYGCALEPVDYEMATKYDAILFINLGVRI